MKPESKACLITGAAGGIGRALVEVFYDAGYHVIGVDRQPKPSDLNLHVYHEMDIEEFAKNETYAHQAAEQIRQSLGGNLLRALINNAAIQILGGINSLSRGEWAETLNTNLLGPFFLIQALAEDLEAARGAVINIGSIHAQLTKKNFLAYATSKAALANLTRALAVDVGTRFRVNAIEPAAINTKMLLDGFAGRDEIRTRLEMCHPIKRIGQTVEIANAALWLASGACDFLHGECIRIDGGISGRLYDPD